MTSFVSVTSGTTFGPSGFPALPLVQQPCGLFSFRSFQLDSAQIADHDKPALQAVARAAKDNRVRIEGNCDERGTTEYNLALGDRRARAAADYLERLGVHAQKIDFVSYGSERSKDPGHDDAAWAKNRRDDVFVR